MNSSTHNQICFHYLLLYFLRKRNYAFLLKQNRIHICMSSVFFIYEKVLIGIPKLRF